MSMEKQVKGSRCFVWTETTWDMVLISGVLTAGSGVKLDLLVQGVPNTGDRHPRPLEGRSSLGPLLSHSWTGGRGRAPLLLPWLLPGRKWETDVTPSTAQSLTEASGP